MEGFAKLLRIPKPTAEASCGGHRPLPSLNALQVLQYRYGVDLDSLQTKTAMMVSGVPLTPKLCRGWSDNCGLGADEAAIATAQLLPMVEAVIRCLSLKDPTKARLLLHQISTPLEKVLADTTLRIEVERFFEQPDLGNVEVMGHYKTGADLKMGGDDLPTGHHQWGGFIKKVPSPSPVRVERWISSTFGLPHEKAEVVEKNSSTGKVTKTVGFQSIHKKRHTYQISYGKSKRVFVKESFKFHVSGHSAAPQDGRTNEIS